MRISARSTLLLGVATPFFLCCASSKPQPVRFSEVPSAPPQAAYANLPHPPITDLEELKVLDRAPLEVLSEKGAGAGVTGATKAEIYLPALSQAVQFKVKAVPSRLDGFNNSPRKELASYLIQKLFLDPEDFVVPTTVIRCVDLDQWSEQHGSASPTVKGTSCVLVNLSFWLKDVTLPDPLYDEERFLDDPRYAYNLANFNVLTYLVNHHDNRKGNFLVSKNDAERRVFAIDNGTTFGAFFFNWFYPPTIAWRQILVPALPRATVERLRKLDRADVDRLGVLTQLEADDTGIMRVVDPGAPFDPAKGARRQGTTVQFGLTKSEIDKVWKRIQALLEDVDEGRVGVF